MDLRHRFYPTKRLFHRGKEMLEKFEKTYFRKKKTSLENKGVKLA